MSGNTYDIWALRINQAIRAREKGPVETAQAPGEEGLKSGLLRFATEAGAIAGAIGRHIEDVEIQGGGRREILEGFIREMIRFQEFSLLEYRYLIPGKRQPGLRFHVRKGEGGLRITVCYFRDLIFWAVDEEGRRIFEVPVRFELAGGPIRGLPNEDYAALYAPCASWREMLRETLALPFRHLYAGDADRSRPLDS